MYSMLTTSMINLSEFALTVRGGILLLNIYFCLEQTANRVPV